jgi:predicted kinase
MNKVIMGIGIPGSGKTTILKRFAEENKYTYICPDDIREELAGDASDQSKDRDVWGVANARLRESYDKGNTIVFDATFADKFYRKMFLDGLREHGVNNIQALYVDIPLETALERNSQRDRQVPEVIIKKMNQSLMDVPPKIEEGIDSLLVIDQNARIIRSETKDYEHLSRR